MLVVMPVTTRQPNPADRLLEAASALFDAEGIRAVGIDRLLARAGVAKASLYQHFESKDELVLAYLRRADRRDRAGYAHAVRAMADRPLDRIRAVFALAEAAARRRGFRGCLYINAVTEFPAARHPVRAVVSEHRAWLAAELTTALAQAGAPDPTRLAGRIQLLYDGALVGSKAAHSVRPIREAAELVDELIGAAVAAVR